MSNVFRKGGYQLSAADSNTNANAQQRAVKPQPFSGGDWAIWFNGKRVANLEAITISESRESVGMYALGNNNALSVLKGKRVLVGSMSLQKWDRDSLIEEVFAVSEGQRALNTADLWAINSAAAAVNNTQSVSISGRTGLTTNNEGSLSLTTDFKTLSMINTSAARGLTDAEANAILGQQLAETARLRGQKEIKFADEIPPFDITVVGLNDAGVMSAMSIYSIYITQKTSGVTMNDLNPSEGFTFICLDVDPLRPVKVDNVYTVN